MADVATQVADAQIKMLLKLLGDLTVLFAKMVAKGIVSADEFVTDRQSSKAFGKGVKLSNMDVYVVSGISKEKLQKCMDQYGIRGKAFQDEKSERIYATVHKRDWKKFREMAEAINNGTYNLDQLNETEEFGTGSDLAPKDEEKIKKENEWVEYPSMEDWIMVPHVEEKKEASRTFERDIPDDTEEKPVYDIVPQEPSGTALYGEVVFTYSKTLDGEYSSELPDEPGKWYMKAEVAESDEYTGLSLITSFRINEYEREEDIEPGIENTEEEKQETIEEKPKEAEDDGYSQPVFVGEIPDDEEKSDRQVARERAANAREEYLESQRNERIDYLSGEYAHKKQITVSSQQELDAVSKNYDGYIRVNFGDAENPAIISEHDSACIVINEGYSAIVSCDTTVKALSNTRVEAFGDAHVIGQDAEVVLNDSSTAEIYGTSYAELKDESIVFASDSSAIVTFDKSEAYLEKGASAVAFGESNIEIHDNAYVDAHGDSHITQFGDSTAYLHDTSSADLYDNTCTYASDNSTVNGHETSTIFASGSANVATFDQSTANVDANSKVQNQYFDQSKFIPITHDDPAFSTFKNVPAEQILANVELNKLLEDEKVEQTLQISLNKKDKIRTVSSEHIISELALARRQASHARAKYVQRNTDERAANQSRTREFENKAAFQNKWKYSLTNKVKAQTAANIVVKGQDELNAIPEKFMGTVIVAFGSKEAPAVISEKTSNPVIVEAGYTTEIYSRTVVEAREGSIVEAFGSAQIYGHDATIIANDESVVEASGSSHVEAYGKSNILAQGHSTISVYDKAEAIIEGQSSAVAFGESKLEVHDNSYVEAYGSATITQYDKSIATLNEHSHSMAYDEAYINARDETMVFADGQAVITATDQTQVIAFGESTVYADKDFPVSMHDNSKRNDLPADLEFKKSENVSQSFSRVYENYTYTRNEGQKTQEVNLNEPERMSSSVETKSQIPSGRKARIIPEIVLTGETASALRQAREEAAAARLNYAQRSANGRAEQLNKTRDIENKSSFENQWKYGHDRFHKENTSSNINIEQPSVGEESQSQLYYHATDGRNLDREQRQSVSVPSYSESQYDTHGKDESVLQKETDISESQAIQPQKYEGSYIGNDQPSQNQEESTIESTSVPTTEQDHVESTSDVAHEQSEAQSHIGGSPVSGDQIVSESSDNQAPSGSLSGYEATVDKNNEYTDNTKPETRSEVTEPTQSVSEKTNEQPYHEGHDSTPLPDTSGDREIVAESNVETDPGPALNYPSDNHTEESQAAPSNLDNQENTGSTSGSKEEYASAEPIVVEQETSLDRNNEYVSEVKDEQGSQENKNPEVHTAIAEPDHQDSQTIQPDHSHYSGNFENQYEDQQGSSVSDNIKETEPKYESPNTGPETGQQQPFNSNQYSGQDSNYQYESSAGTKTTEEQHAGIGSPQTHNDSIPETNTGRQYNNDTINVSTLDRNHDSIIGSTSQENYTQGVQNNYGNFNEARQVDVWEQPQKEASNIYSGSNAPGQYGSTSGSYNQGTSNIVYNDAIKQQESGGTYPSSGIQSGSNEQNYVGGGAVGNNIQQSQYKDVGYAQNQYGNSYQNTASGNSSNYGKAESVQTWEQPTKETNRNINPGPVVSQSVPEKMSPQGFADRNNNQQDNYRQEYTGNQGASNPTTNTGIGAHQSGQNYTTQQLRGSVSVNTWEQPANNDQKRAQNSSHINAVVGAAGVISEGLRGNSDRNSQNYSGARKNQYNEPQIRQTRSGKDLFSGYDENKINENSRKVERSHNVTGNRLDQEFINRTNRASGPVNRSENSASSKNLAEEVANSRGTQTSYMPGFKGTTAGNTSAFGEQWYDRKDRQVPNATGNSRLKNYSGIGTGPKAAPNPKWPNPPGSGRPDGNNGGPVGPAGKGKSRSSWKGPDGPNPPGPNPPGPGPSGPGGGPGGGPPGGSDSNEQARITYDRLQFKKSDLIPWMYKKTSQAIGTYVVNSFAVGFRDWNELGRATDGLVMGVGSLGLKRAAPAIEHGVFSRINKKMESDKKKGIANVGHIMELDFSNSRSGRKSKKEFDNLMISLGLASKRNKFTKREWTDYEKIHIAFKNGTLEHTLRQSKRFQGLSDTEMKQVTEDIRLKVKGFSKIDGNKKASSDAAKNFRHRINTFLVSADEVFKASVEELRGYKLAVYSGVRAARTTAVFITKLGGFINNRIYVMAYNIAQHTPLKDKATSLNDKKKELEQKHQDKKDAKAQKKSTRAESKRKKKEDKRKERIEELKKRMPKFYEKVYMPLQIRLTRLQQITEKVTAVLAAPFKIFDLYSRAKEKLYRWIIMIAGGAILGCFLFCGCVVVIDYWVENIFGFRADDDGNDVDEANIYDSVMGKALTWLQDAETDWATDLKNVKDIDDIFEAGFKFGRDYLEGDEYVETMDTDGMLTYLESGSSASFIGNPFASYNLTADVMSALGKVITTVDGGNEVVFEGVNSSRTSNIKDILCMAAVYFENDTEAVDENATEVDSSDVAAEEPSGMTYAESTETISTDVTSGVLKAYAQDLFNASHNDVIELDYIILPTLFTDYSFGTTNEDDSVEIKTEETECTEYDDGGCMSYDGFNVVGYGETTDKEGNTIQFAKAGIETADGTISDVSSIAGIPDEVDFCMPSDEYGIDLDTALDNNAIYDYACFTAEESDTSPYATIIVEEGDPVDFYDLPSGSSDGSIESLLSNKGIAYEFSEVTSSTGIKTTVITRRYWDESPTAIWPEKDDDETDPDTGELIKEGDTHIYYEYTAYEVSVTITWKCAGVHTGYYCGGHLKSEITGLVYSFTDEQIDDPDNAEGKVESGTYIHQNVLKTKFDSDVYETAEDIFDIDAAMIHTSEMRTWEGWTEDNVQLALYKYNADWEEWYGITFTTELGGESLTVVDKENIMDAILEAYPDLSEERISVIETALDFVGNLGYDQDHHGDHPLTIGGSTDCSGFVSNLWYERLGKIYYTGLFESTFKGTSIWYDYSSGAAEPGDILLRLPGGNQNHAMLYLGKFSYNGEEAEWIIDCSSDKGVGSVFFRARSDSYYSSCYVLKPDGIG